jgi:hypothetical protein
MLLLLKNKKKMLLLLEINPFFEFVGLLNSRVWAGEG